MLDNSEKERYLRQILLPDFGEEAQEKLKQSTAFISGAGGLGGPVAFYLAAAGVGHLIICDRDHVDLSNLNRQILHGTHDIGKPKSESALQTLQDLNPHICIDVHTISIDDDNIGLYAKDADIIVDCLDNVPTRLVLNRFGIAKGIPIMHAGINNWTSQITLVDPPKTPCLNCLFDSEEEASGPKPVLGAVAGVTGTMQALETIKFLIGAEGNLRNQLLYFDAKNAEWTKLSVNKNVNCKVCSSL